MMSNNTTNDYVVPELFTREDVRLLRKIAPRFGETGKRRKAVLDLAARIEALLQDGDS